MKDHNKKIFLKGILEYSSNLKLATFKDTVESEIRNATEIDSSYEELIYKLLQKECDYKQEQLRKNRIRTANFPYKKYLEEYDNKHFHVLDFVLKEQLYIFIFLVFAFLVGAEMLLDAYM